MLILNGFAGGHFLRTKSTAFEGTCFMSHSNQRRLQTAQGKPNRFWLKQQSNLLSITMFVDNYFLWQLGNRITLSIFFGFVLQFVTSLTVTIFAYRLHFSALLIGVGTFEACDWGNVSKFSESVDLRTDGVSRRNRNKQNLSLARNSLIAPTFTRFLSNSALVFGAEM